MICGFCGKRFALAEAEDVCRSCPIAAGCHLVRCPHCGYEMPPEAKLISSLKALRRRVSRNGHKRRRRMRRRRARLAELRPGQYGKVTALHAEDAKTLQKLVAMNLLPGEPICLLRRSPSLVFQVGYSQFAVDEEIGELIEVKLE